MSANQDANKFIRLVVDYGYDVHSCELPRRAIQLARSGREFTMKGQGFHWDGVFDQDYWQFNRTPGHLYVFTAGGGEIYNGRLGDPEVRIN